MPSNPRAERTDPEEYAEWVLRCVEEVPAGHVTTYGSIADAVGAVLGSGGPRQVGHVMSQHGSAVTWWRVVRADGTPPACHDGTAQQAYRAEATPLLASGRIDLRRAFVAAVLPPPDPPAT